MAEHFEGGLNSSIGSCLTAAQKLNDPDIDVLVHGKGDSVEAQVSELKKYAGVRKIITASNDNLENPYGQAMAKIATKLI